MKYITSFKEPSFSELEQLFNKGFRFNYLHVHVVAAMIIFGVTAGFIFDSYTYSLPTRLLIFGLAQLGTYLLIRTTRRYLVKNFRKTFIYQSFAKQNDLVFLNNGSIGDGKRDNDINLGRATELPLRLDGALFRDKHPSALTYIVGNSQFAIYDYQYTTGSGKNRKTHYWHVATWKLSRPLPHVLFDSKKNNFWKFSNLPNSFDRSQIISLESTFDDHFDFYSPQGYGIDTLSYITPEILTLLINDYDKLDIEIIEDHLYIYSKSKLKAEKFWDLFNKLNRLALEIEDNTDNYRDQRATKSASVGTARSAIAKPGLRLKKNIWPSLISGIILFFYLGFRLRFEAGFSWSVVLVLGSIILFASVWYYAIKKKKNNG